MPWKTYSNKNPDTASTSACKPSFPMLLKKGDIDVISPKRGPLFQESTMLSTAPFICNVFSQRPTRGLGGNPFYKLNPWTSLINNDPTTPRHNPSKIITRIWLFVYIALLLVRRRWRARKIRWWRGASWIIPRRNKGLPPSTFWVFTYEKFCDADILVSTDLMFLIRMIGKVIQRWGDGLCSSLH